MRTTLIVQNHTLKKYEGMDEIVVIPEEVQIIEAYVFSGMKHIKSIIFPSSLKEIGQYAFYDCEGIEEVILPDSIYYLEGGIFSRCKQLKKVKLPSHLTTLPKSTFYQCEQLEEVILSNNLKKIGHSCFEQCHSLKEIHLPESLKEIGDNCFDDCISLESIYLPEGLESIKNNVFFHCTKLASILIPVSIKEIGIGAFETRGKVQIVSHPNICLRACMFDNNWNMNWNFGANKRYNGKNEENYQFYNSYMPNILLKEWKQEAQIILCINYLETYKECNEQYESVIQHLKHEIINKMIEQKRYVALNNGIIHHLINIQNINLTCIQDVDERTKLLEMSQKEQEIDLMDLL